MYQYVRGGLLNLKVFFKVSNRPMTLHASIHSSLSQIKLKLIVLIHWLYLFSAVWDPHHQYNTDIMWGNAGTIFVHADVCSTLWLQTWKNFKIPCRNVYLICGVCGLVVRHWNVGREVSGSNPGEWQARRSNQEKAFSTFSPYSGVKWVPGTYINLNVRLQDFPYFTGMRMVS